jgi:hypothetical protein
MMRLYFILLMLAFVSCGRHSNSEFKLQNSFQIKLQNQICINTKDCFYFNTDSSLYQLFMYYSNAEWEKKKLIDTVDFSPYKSKIHSFQSLNNESYVVLWETEYEIYPLIYAYYITEGEIVKIGELLISLPCQSCESFEYPIKDIRILQNGKEIEISFLKDVNYKPKNSIDWQLYKAGVLKCIFNTETNELKYISSLN